MTGEVIRQEVALRPGVNGTLCEAEAFLERRYMGGKKKVCPSKKKVVGKK